MTDYKWKHIEDLPDGFNPPLQDNEILRKAWRDHQVKLAGSDAVAKFNERLAREWSIETGIIERLYSIDKGTTQILIERGIDEALIPYGSTDRPAPEIIKILKTHEDVLEGLFDFVKEDRPLTVSYIREVHQAITNDQESVDGQDQFGNPVRTKLIKGDWKQYPNNPKQSDGSIHEYCPPDHVQLEMERLVELHQAHITRELSPEIQAAWLHHRFTQIHPFQDGNGRVARILASLILIKAGGLPFIVRRDVRDAYLDALEAADFGDMLSFAKFVSEEQTHGLLKALEIAEGTRSEQMSEIIKAGAEKLQVRERFTKNNKALATLILRLKEIGNEICTPIAEQLNDVIGKVNSDFTAWPVNESNNDDFDDATLGRTIKVLKEQGYNISTTAFHNGFGILLNDYQLTSIEVGLISIEPVEQGLIAVTAYMAQELMTRDRTIVPDLIPLSAVPFVVSADQSVESVNHAFREWLTTALTLGLAEWQKRIK